MPAKPILSDAERRARNLAGRVAWNQKNQAKRRAHREVVVALRRGTLTKRPCEICGNAKTHAHHDDYSKPLEVLWLCAKCHAARHKQLAAAGVKINEPSIHERTNCPSTPGLTGVKLTIEKAQEIRKLAAQGILHREIAARFGVDRSHVSAIVRNKTWKEAA